MCVGLKTRLTTFVYYGFVIGAWVVAAAFLGIGIYLAVENPTMKYSSIFTDLNTAVWDASVYMLIPAGAVLVGFGVVGCCGSLRQSTCLIWIFCIALIVFICGELAIMVMAGVFKEDVKADMRDIMQEQVSSKYVDEGSEDEYSQDWNNMQKDLKCCGSNYYTDYYLYSDFYDNKNRLVPYTCCEEEQTNYDRCLDEARGNETEVITLYRNGCYSELLLTMEDQMSMIIATCFIAVCVQIGGVIFGCSLRDNIKKFGPTSK